MCLHFYQPFHNAQKKRNPCMQACKENLPCAMVTLQNILATKIYPPNYQIIQMVCP